MVSIDPDFREKREMVEQIDGIDVWGPLDPRRAREFARETLRV